MLQGSDLGLIQLNDFLIDLEEDIKSRLIIFAGDTETGEMATNQEEKLLIQSKLGLRD